MEKTKFEFIKELLVNKKINHVQRERILELASREFTFDGTLEERVRKIEKIIYNNQPDYNPITSSQNVKNDNSDLPDYIDPYNLYKFLFEYNQNRILRYTCHDIDSDGIEIINEFCGTESYCFSKHLNKIIEAYIEFEKANRFVSYIKPLIRGYLTGKGSKGNDIKEGWSSGKIKINWSSDQLKEWCEKNPGIPPNINTALAGDKEVELLSIDPQIISPISYDPIQHFTGLVLHFKNLFHLKSGRQSLMEILKRVNTEKKWKEKVEITFSEDLFQRNLEHFTDVDKLIQAYNKLLDIIIEQARKHNDEKPEVELRFYEDKGTVYLSIRHKNSQYNKSLESTLTRPFGSSYTSLIKNQINGLCNLRLKANFGDKKFAEINLWDGKGIEKNELPSFDGVEHLLEFPKDKKI